MSGKHSVSRYPEQRSGTVEVGRDRPRILRKQRQAATTDKATLQGGLRGGRGTEADQEESR